MTRQDAADFLGIPINAPAHEINRAYREQCRRLHPDGGGVASQFHLLTKARDILLRDTPVLGLNKGEKGIIPRLFPLWSYPWRISLAAIKHPNLGGRAVRAWLVVIIGLPLAYLVAKEFLMLSLIPLAVLFLALAVFRRLS